VLTTNAINLELCAGPAEEREAFLEEVSQQRRAEKIVGRTRTPWPSFRAPRGDSRVEDKRPGSRLCLLRLAPLEDRLAMLLKGVQARLESMKHRDGAIRLLSGLS
jgi:hypothetical protein